VLVALAGGVAIGTVLGVGARHLASAGVAWLMGRAFSSSAAGAVA
jgi:hypothetical protein